MKRALPILLLAFAACGSWKVTTHKTLLATQLSGAEVREKLGSVCLQEINECVRQGKTAKDCKALVACDKGLRAAKTLQRAVMLGLVAIEAASEKDAASALSRALEALNQIRQILIEWGVEI